MAMCSLELGVAGGGVGAFCFVALVPLQGVAGCCCCCPQTSLAILILCWRNSSNIFKQFGHTGGFYGSSQGRVGGARIRAQSNCSFLQCVHAPQNLWSAFRLPRFPVHKIGLPRNLHFKVRKARRPPQHLLPARAFPNATSRDSFCSRRRPISQNEPPACPKTAIHHTCARNELPTTKTQSSPRAGHEKRPQAMQLFVNPEAQMEVQISSQGQGANVVLKSGFGHRRACEPRSADFMQRRGNADFAAGAANVPCMWLLLNHC